MTLETFFEKFDLFADAPDAVAKMRELMLDLAVRGKLVVQNVTDEPAAQLLKRVLAEKNRRTGRSERSDEEAGSPPGDEAFEIPVNWEWIGATTPAVMVSDQGKKVQTKDILEAGKYPVVDQGKMFIRGYCDDSDKVISVAEPIVLFGDHTRGTKFIDFDFVVGADGVKLLQPICIDPRFYFLVLCWLPLESRGYARHFKLLKAARIPLPPLAEQKRIVAKVDELMALCDRLEAQQQEREEQASQLARASLARFADAPTPANLEYLFHSSFIIPPSSLRQSILTLAVQGKLVPQDPNDEPVTELLSRLVLLTARGGKIPKALTPIDTDALPFDIPLYWEWVQAQELCRAPHIITYGVLKPVWVDVGVPTIRVQDIQNGEIVSEGIGQCSTERAAKFAKTTLETGDIVIAKDGATLGKTAVVPPSVAGGNITQHVLRFPVTPEVDSTYVRLVINSPHGQAWMKGETKGVALPGVNVGDFRRMPLPLPPLAEQRRIVAKVEQLMALVDALETQLAASRATAANLLSALVAELTAA